MAHFSDKGAHCEAEYCHKLDFLPFKCEFCGHLYCVEHFRPRDHACTSPGEKALNKLAAICPLCDSVLKYTEADDLEGVMSEHQKTELCLYKREHKDAPRPRCPVKGCREILTFSNRLECKKCGNMVCLKHRAPQDHVCERKKSTGFTKTSSRDAVANFLASESAYYKPSQWE